MLFPTHKCDKCGKVFLIWPINHPYECPKNKEFYNKKNSLY